MVVLHLTKTCLDRSIGQAAAEPYSFSSMFLPASCDVVNGRVRLLPSSSHLLGYDLDTTNVGPLSGHQTRCASACYLAYLCMLSLSAAVWLADPRPTRGRAP